MQNKSRTQRKSRTKKNGAVTAAGPFAWANGSSNTELKCYSDVSGNFQLYHNLGIPYFNLQSLLDNIVPTTGVNGRIGNRIFVKEVDIQMVLNNKVDRPNVTYRFVVVAAPVTVATDAYTELFAGGGICGAHLPTGSTLLHDAVIPVNQGSTQFVASAATGATKERSCYHRATIPINKPVVYSPATAGCSTRITGWIVAYDAFGTLTTDNIASVAATSYRILYTDA
jgi:hypothetical protein